MLFLIFIHLLVMSSAFTGRSTPQYLQRSLRMALKFDPSDFLKVSVSRPLGIELEEIDDGTFRGVYIAGFVKDGNVDKALRKEFLSPKGLFLVEANGIDLRSSDFDTAMDAITSAEENQNVDLIFIDPSAVLKGTAVLDVILPDGQTRVIKCLKGMRLRSVLLENKVDVYDLKGKLSNCGGGGICATCVVNLEVPNNDWSPKPDFEFKKLKKYGDNSRLSCNVIVEGDARVEIQPKMLS